MYVHFSVVKIDPTNKGKFLDFANSGEGQAMLKASKGFQQSYLIQSRTDPQEFISVTLWDTAEDAHTLIAKPEYAAVWGGVRDLLLAPPERREYDVLVSYP